MITGLQVAHFEIGNYIALGFALPELGFLVVSVASFWIFGVRPSHPWSVALKTAAATTDDGDGPAAGHGNQALPCPMPCRLLS